MNKLNVLKAVKVVAGIAAVASAVAGTVMVVKTVRQYQEDSVTAINKAEAEGFETDEEAKEVTEKLQMDGLKVVAASVGTVAVSGIFALVAYRISIAEKNVVANNIALQDAFMTIANGCLGDKLESMVDNLNINNDDDLHKFVIDAISNEESLNSSKDMFVDRIKNARYLYDESKAYLINNVEEAVAAIKVGQR